MQCSICLDDLEGGPTLACGHRFHAACLARLAGANGTTPTRRGALTACPNCRTVSRVALTPVAAPAPARTARPPPVVAPTRPPPPRALGRPPAPRGLPLRRTKKKPKQKSVEGSRQKKSGKWFHRSFPGREFEDLDAIRAAKRQRAEQRAAYSAQLDAYTGS